MKKSGFSVVSQFLIHLFNKVPSAMRNFIEVQQQIKAHSYINSAPMSFLFQNNLQFLSIIFILINQNLLSEMGNKQKKKQPTQLQLSLNTALQVYLDWRAKDTESLPQLFNEEQLSQIDKYLKGSKILEDSVKPEPDYPYLNHNRRTVWKLLLIAPTLEYQPLQPYDHFISLEVSPSSSHMVNFIQTDTKRTFPFSKTLDKTKLQRLSVALFCHIFKPIGYNSGETYILAFLLQCGFSELETFYIFISLKVGKKFQFTRTLPTEEESTSFHNKILRHFQQYLRKYNEKIPKVFSNFPFQIKQLCVGQLLTLFCNFGHEKMKNIIILWDDIVCSQETLAESFLRIYCRIAEIWYFDYYPKFQQFHYDEQFQSWRLFITDLRENQCQRAIFKGDPAKMAAYHKELRQKFIHPYHSQASYEKYVFSICAQFKTKKKRNH